ncbi:MAG: polyribonucleotide nucleotidyltransferase [candidate division KSB1 bacterium]|nr:polyribonucleotide nucleotidyltransferase [candidate division KSB1 bacterium]
MIYERSTEIGGRRLLLQSGKVARQANGSVWVQYGETVVLATATLSDVEIPPQGFFPLSVEYREKAYAAGRIPGGFFKREGKPTESEVLSSRLIDRPIRPLFPKELHREVQVIVWVLSADRMNDPDILGIIGASAALMISDIPFGGPVGAARVGRIGGKFILNPTYEELERSDMDIVVAGTADSIVMVEGEAREVPEEDLLRALEFAHERGIRPSIELQLQLREDCGREKISLEPEVIDEALLVAIRERADQPLDEAIRIADKTQRKQFLQNLVDRVVQELSETFPDSEQAVVEVVTEMQKAKVRRMIVEERRRIDGRQLDEIRPVSCEVGVLPRAHGSALFCRGQTQALAATTLGTKMDEQKMEELEGDFFKSYMLHYNFPPFSVGEVRPLRGPSRREIGHGSLAERALKPMIPSEEVFPYTIRVVSDILESNGSSSMATVCAGSLSLMDAGVPVKDAVAGIAMGLVRENGEYLLLTDILGEEDHFGDMDFKVAGSKLGVTAVQMDLKISGVPVEVMSRALAKAREARMHILEVMNATLPAPRPELSPYAPRIVTIHIGVDQIGLVIGPGGKTIREIIEKTGATVDIEDDGTVHIASTDPEACQRAKEMIERITEVPEIGKVYIGKVKRITNFGAFIEISPGKEGLLHISELEHHRVRRVEDVLKVGDEIEVKLIGIDTNGKLDFSRKALLPKEEGAGQEAGGRAERGKAPVRGGERRHGRGQDRRSPR